MQSTKKANSVVTTSYDAAAAAWLFTVAGHGTATLPRNLLSAAVCERGLIEGISDRIIDCAAIERTDADGNIRSAAEMARLKWEGIQAIVAHFATGTDQWSRKGTGSGPSTDTLIIIEGIMAANGESREAANARIDAWTKSLGKSRTTVLQSFAANPRVAAAIQTIRAERTKGIDTEAMLDTLPAAE